MALVDELRDLARKWGASEEGRNADAAMEDYLEIARDPNGADRVLGHFEGKVRKQAEALGPEGKKALSFLFTEGPDLLGPLLGLSDEVMHSSMIAWLLKQHRQAPELHRRLLRSFLALASVSERSLGNVANCGPAEIRVDRESAMGGKHSERGQGVRRADVVVWAPGLLCMVEMKVGAEVDYGQLRDYLSEAKGSGGNERERVVVLLTQIPAGSLGEDDEDDNDHTAESRRARSRTDWKELTEQSQEDRVRLVHVDLKQLLACWLPHAESGSTETHRLLSLYLRSLAKLAGCHEHGPLQSWSYTTKFRAIELAGTIAADHGSE